MEGHQRLCDINTRLLNGGDVTETERRETTAFFLSQRADAASLRSNPPRLCAGGTYSPLFFTPPWPDGKRARLITGHLPKTGILHANHYELEVVRLLLLFAPQNPEVRDMAARTSERLEHTCFGKFCPKGECVAAGVCALRFYNVHAPGDAQKRRRLLEPLGKLFLRAGPGRSEWQCQLPVSYFLLALSETQDDMAVGLIRAKRDWLQRLSMSTKGLAFAARRALAMLPECAGLNREPATFNL
ncbi:MAG: hypothetical protein FWF96_01160 [Kiritimatiellaeota bacterium]|nr:hypothetical protein [Kiritimatiellota bacterium]